MEKSCTRLSTVPVRLIQTASESSGDDIKPIKNPKTKGTSINSKTMTPIEVKECAQRKLANFQRDNSEDELLLDMTNKNNVDDIMDDKKTKKGPLSAKENNTSFSIDENEQKDKNGSILSSHMNSSPMKKNKNNLPKIKSIETFHFVKQNQEDVTKLKILIENLKEQNFSFKKGKESYKKKYIELKCNFDKLRDINQEIQEALFENWKEKTEKIDQLLLLPSNISLVNEKFPATGTKRVTDNLVRYHIGRNIWIHEDAYNGLINSSRNKPTRIAGNIITAVFSMNELMISTISGLTSKRRGKVEKCEKLNVTKMRACEDFYIYWMNNIYKPSEEGLESFHSDLAKFQSYAGKKIAELKRLPDDSDKQAKQKTKLLALQEKEEEEEEEQLNNKQEGNEKKSKNHIEQNSSSIEAENEKHADDHLLGISSVDFDHQHDAINKNQNDKHSEIVDVQFIETADASNTQPASTHYEENLDDPLQLSDEDSACSLKSWSSGSTNHSE